MRIKFRDYLEGIRDKKPKRILLQVPEGLKTRALEIAKEIENETRAETIISGEPCYGACDLRLDEARMLGCDLILHFGHLDFGVSSEIPVIYIPTEINLEINKELKEELKKISETKINIYSSEPFRKSLDSVEKFLGEIGKEVSEKKIILGCSEPEEKGEVNIFVGSGRFHPLTLKGKTYFLDLERNKIEDVSYLIEKEERKKQARIEKFKEARKVGILLSKKPGQFYRKYSELKERLEKQGRKVEILIFDEITEDKLVGLDFDFYINTACPRIELSHPTVHIRDIFN